MAVVIAAENLLRQVRVPQVETVEALHELLLIIARIEAILVQILLVGGELVSVRLWKLDWLAVRQLTGLMLLTSIIKNARY